MCHTLHLCTTSTTQTPVSKVDRTRKHLEMGWCGEVVFQRDRGVRANLLHVTSKEERSVITFSHPPLYRPHRPHFKACALHWTNLIPSPRQLKLFNQSKLVRQRTYQRLVARRSEPTSHMYEAFERSSCVQITLRRSIFRSSGKLSCCWCFDDWKVKWGRLIALNILWHIVV